jgi:glycosyltransferase involved in cell wall biosynthesis
MKICLYSPYFPKHLGGGEKYLLDVASTLAQFGSVAITIPGKSLAQTDKELILKKYQHFMGEQLTGIKFISSPLGTKASALEKLMWTKQFDLLYYQTDGSLFASLAKKNVMHIQVPIKRSPLSLTEKIKAKSWNFVNTNSAFTKRVVENHWQLPVDAVHYPMIDTKRLAAAAKKQPKEKIILHVGRFFRQLHSKRQDVLVDFFTKLIDLYPQAAKGWKLVLVGSLEDEQYAQEVADQAKGLPIEIIHTVSREKLNEWYAKASLYWHATGYGVSEDDFPEKMEHFGISTVEAMAAGAVPVVINKGGQPEVLGDRLQELLWDGQQACLAKTAELMNNKDAREALANQVHKRATHFGQQAFEQQLVQMLETLNLNHG